MEAVVAYVMLYGVGWTQRWLVAEGALPDVQDQIGRVGRDETGRLAIVDPGSGEPTTLLVAWQHVAAAVVLESGAPVGAADTDTSGGQYR
jgi:hypothetical protein